MLMGTERRSQHMLYVMITPASHDRSAGYVTMSAFGVILDYCGRAARTVLRNGCIGSAVVSIREPAHTSGYRLHGSILAATIICGIPTPRSLVVRKGQSLYGGDSSSPAPCRGTHANRGRSVGWTSCRVGHPLLLYKWVREKTVW